jgi:hypothetical protein
MPVISVAAESDVRPSSPSSSSSLDAHLLQVHNNCGYRDIFWAACGVYAELIVFCEGMSEVLYL